jgi:hypothetical protein
VVSFTRFTEQAEASGQNIRHAPGLSINATARADCLKPFEAPRRGETHMPDNRVSATLSNADQQAVLAAINTIRQKLSFLIDLTPEERRTILRMGDGSRAFVSQALEVASQNTDILPRSFDVEEMRKDVELLAALSPIMVALAQLNELVDDTFMEVGSEAYAAGLAVYQYVRAAGKGAALDGALDTLGQRFARKSRGAAPKKPDGNS